MHSQRLQAFIELLAESDLWHSENELTRLQGRLATEDELQLIHTPEPHKENSRMRVWMQKKGKRSY